jgi:hypothetical protein
MSRSSSSWSWAGGQVVADAGQGQAEAAQAGDGQRPLELLGTVGPVTGGRVDAGGDQQAQVLVVAQGADGQPSLAG